MLSLHIRNFKKYTMKIGIFCSANADIDPDFFTATEKLGRWMGRQGHTLVYGGCNLGLMECVGQAVRAGGGRTIGVVPRIIESQGKMSDQVQVCIPCDNLSDRKDLILLHSDLLIALPGGIGTLDEVFTVAAAHTIGYHRKRLIIYNMKSFYSSLIALLDDLDARGMIRGSWRDYIQVADSQQQIEQMVAAAQ